MRSRMARARSVMCCSTSKVRRRAEDAGERVVVHLEVLGRLEVLPGGGALHEPHVLERAAHAEVGALVHGEVGDVLAAVADPARRWGRRSP